MKKQPFYIIAGIFLLFSCLNSTAQVHINIINSWGYNIIDFEELMGVPYWDQNNPSSDTQITDDSPFVYKGGVQVTFEVTEKLRLGGEAGINRLYYVEERYSVLLDKEEYRWRMYDIWTLNIGGLAQLFLSDKVYFQTGAGVHNFMNGSGTALGVMGGLGYELPLSEKFSIPIEFRNDWVFGDATSGVFSLAVGFMINL